MKKKVIIIIVCAILLVGNIVLYTNLKDRNAYITKLENRQKEENLNKLYYVYDEIVLCWNFSKMSDDEIVIALAKDAAFCEAAKELYGETDLYDNDATFGYALIYTEDYINYLLENRTLIKNKNVNDNLEKLSNALDYAVENRETKLIKEYYEVAKEICVENGIEE